MLSKHLVDTTPTHGVPPMTPMIPQTAPVSFRLDVVMLLGRDRVWSQDSRCERVGSQEPAGPKGHRRDRDQANRLISAA